MSTGETITAVKVAKNRGGFAIGSAFRLAGLAKLRDRIKELELDTKSPKIKIVGCTSESVGTDKAKGVSITRYETIWKGLLDFCFLVEDYDSAMLVARNECPKDPLPVSLDTAIAFMRYKVLKLGTVLLHHKTNEPILSSSEKSLTCLGQWTSVSSVKMYASALQKVHSHYETTHGSYEAECENCRQLDIKLIMKGHGCSRHAGKPRYWRAGSVVNHPDFKNHLAQMQTYVEEHYESRQTFAFLPGELRDIRTHLLSHNSVFHLMIWTIIIVGIKLFLRIDEVLDMTVEQFIQKYFVVTEDGVEGLCAKVKGKTDTESKHLALWDDKECPEFSPARAILIWIAVSGITSGRLFPADLLKPDSESFPYEKFLDIIKDLCTGVLKKDMSDPAMKNLILGTHMLRKTAFLLAFWGFVRGTKSTKLGPMDEANILLSARHKDISSTATYLSDSGTLKALLDRVDKDDMHHRVSEWVPIHIKTTDSFAALNMPSMRFIKPLVELADDFVFKDLKVPKDGRFGRKSIAQIHQLACAYVPDLSIEEELEAVLKKEVRPEVAAMLINMARKASEEKAKAAVFHALETAKVPPMTATTSTVGASTSNKKRKVQNAVTVSRDYQNNYNATKDRKEKVALLVEAIGEIKKETAQGKILVDPLKTFAYRAAKIVDCVDCCHGGSVDAFVRANSGFTISRFACSSGVKHQGTFDQTKLL